VALVAYPLTLRQFNCSLIKIMTNRTLQRSAKLAPLLLVTALLFHPLVSPLAALAFTLTQREHLTAEEVEFVRDAQELDRRMAVFIKAAERRLLAITDPATAAKQEQKEAEKWGAIAASTRAQLLSDIARILDEAITNIDDAGVHNAKSPLIPKSLQKLAEASNSFLPKLTALRSSAAESSERDSLEQAIEHVQTVIEAAGKLKPVSQK